MDKSVYNSIQAGFGGKRSSITKFDTDGRNFTLTTNKLLVRDSHIWKGNKFASPDPHKYDSVLSLESSNDSPVRTFSKADFYNNDSIVSGRQTSCVYPQSINLGETARKGIKSSGGFRNRRRLQQSLATNTINNEISSAMKTICDRDSNKKHDEMDVGRQLNMLYHEEKKTYGRL